MSYSSTEPWKSCAWPGSEGIDSRIKARCSEGTPEMDRNISKWSPENFFRLWFVICLSNNVTYYMLHV